MKRLIKLIHFDHTEPLSYSDSRLLWFQEKTQEETQEKSEESPAGETGMELLGLGRILENDNY